MGTRRNSPSLGRGGETQAGRREKTAGRRLVDTGPAQALGDLVLSCLYSSRRPQPPLVSASARVGLSGALRVQE